MKFYKLVQKQYIYHVKWVEVNGVRKEKRIMTENNKRVLDVYINKEKANRKRGQQNKQLSNFEATRNIKTETIGKNSRGVDELVLYGCEVEPFETNRFTTFSNGKIGVCLDGLEFISKDCTNDFEK